MNNNDEVKFKVNIGRLSASQLDHVLTKLGRAARNLARESPYMQVLDGEFLPIEDQEDLDVIAVMEVIELTPEVTLEDKIRECLRGVPSSPVVVERLVKLMNEHRKETLEQVEHELEKLKSNTMLPGSLAQCLTAVRDLYDSTS